MSLKIGFAQINPTVGDIDGNAALIRNAYKEGVQNQCALLLFPEMALSGYPPEDLLYKAAFLEANEKMLDTLAREMDGPATFLGFPHHAKGSLLNAAAWIKNGKIERVYNKQHLPNYGVFDEKRYFSPGKNFQVVTLAGIRLGLTICEDIWMGDHALAPLKKLKPDVVLNISASPFFAGKLPLRHQTAAKAARYLSAPLLYCNLVGGQDELIFDGGSFACSKSGKIVWQAPLFKEGLFSLEIVKNGKGWEVLPAGVQPLKISKTEEIYEALLLGIRDYVNKNGFTKVALGISGGIDSALVAALAMKALGPERTTGVTMPSQFNSSDTVGDSYSLAKNLGIRLYEIPIHSMYATYLHALAPQFVGQEKNIAEENLQARIRGNLLMALSNKFGWLILTTGNKSETSTGYCTLYGDTAGGFAVLKDVLKTTVYDLARFINKTEKRELIPESIIKRPPTAELKVNQKDEDSLGSYARLDPIIVDYVEKNRSIKAITSALHEDPAHVKRIVGLIDRNEYKRRQAPPGIKITPRSFGRDHRMPITNRFRENS